MSIPPLENISSQKQKGFLSVITPVLNAERFMPKALKNVINQDTKNMEHIIVDGGSTDATVEICRDAALKHPHIRVIVRKGWNQSRSMNEGLREARGRIISFLNADDYYEPGVFKRALPLFQKAPEPAFLFGCCKVRDENHAVLGVHAPEIPVFHKILRGSVLHEHPLNPSSYFYDSLIHDNVGLYDEALDFSMDLDFIIRAIRVAHFVSRPGIWGNFMARPGAKTFELTMANKIYAIDKSILRRYWPELPVLERLKARVCFEYTMNPAVLRTRRALSPIKQAFMPRTS